MAKDMAFPKIGRNVLLIILAILVLVLVFRKNIMRMFKFNESFQEGAKAKPKAPAKAAATVKTEMKAAAQAAQAAAAAAAAAKARQTTTTLPPKTLPDSVSFTGGSNITIEGNNLILPCVKGSSGSYRSVNGVTANYRCDTIGNNSDLYKKLKAAYTKAKNTVSTTYNNDIAEANKIISAAKTKRDTVNSSIEKEFDTLRSKYVLIK
jgi:hypothetical protein